MGNCQISGTPSVSIVVPTFREADSLEPLVRRVFAATREAGIDAEIIVVDDDSRDGSEELVDRLSATFPVRIVIRRNKRGLASAVLHGFEHAAGDVIVVMDADLQHPPEAVPSLVAAVVRGDADIAVGSRYVAGGSVGDDWPALRRLNSWVATLAARPLVRLSDPMSGFCAMRREVWRRAEKLDPIGYKIVLELIVKSRSRSIVEVPIAFSKREAGSSKLSFCEQWKYLRHLHRLYWFRFRGVMRSLALAAVVGSLYWVWTNV